MTAYKNGPVAEIVAQRADEKQAPGRWETTMRNKAGDVLVTVDGEIERSYQNTSREATRYARFLGRHHNVPATVKL